MASSAKVAVAGAGALGLSCALGLADAGCAVTVYDPGPPYANASGVAGGMLAPVFEAVLDAEAAAPHFELLMAARDLWPALAARAGLGLERLGALAAGRADWLQGIAEAVGRLGLHTSELPVRTAQALAPGLSDDLDGVLLNREDWRLDPRWALAALRRSAEEAGVAFRREALSARGAADFLVVATGAAASGLAPELDRLSPIKGHILRVAAPGLGGAVVRGEGVYAVPTEGGLAVGATMEPGVADPAVDPAQAAPLAQAGARLFPAVSGAPRELLAGVRATTADGLPLVGGSVEPGVLLATGARRNGWLLAPLVARTIAACVTGGEPGPYAARLDPRRFEGGA
jgi:glycine oxidase